MYRDLFTLWALPIPTPVIADSQAASLATSELVSTRYPSARGESIYAIASADFERAPCVATCACVRVFSGRISAEKRGWVPASLA